MSLELDFSQIRRELLRSIRGHRSQTSLSHDLNYSFNQLGKWEKGHTRILWPDFVAVCTACERDLKAALSHVLQFDGDLAVASDLVHRLIGTTSIHDITRLTGFSRYKISRWLNDSVVPDLQDILTLIHCCGLPLFDLLAELAPIDSMPYVNTVYEQLISNRRIHHMAPYVGAVMRSLELEEYTRLQKHADEFVASQVGISLAEARATIARLAELGAITWKKGKYYVVPEHRRLDTRADFEVAASSPVFWMKRAISVVEGSRNGPRPEGMMLGHRVFTVSDAKRKVLMERTSQFYTDVVNLIGSDDGPCDSIWVLNFQLVPVRLPEESEQGDAVNGR